MPPRYDIADIGGLDAIHSMRMRSRSSIRMKIKNIVAMCDEEGISRSSIEDALSGLPTGKTGRKTNWDVLSQYVTVPQDQHLNECQLIIAKAYTWPGELTDASTFSEGSKR